MIKNKEHMSINVHMNLDSSTKKSRIIGKSYKRGIPDSDGN